HLLRSLAVRFARRTSCARGATCPTGVLVSGMLGRRGGLVGTQHVDEYDHPTTECCDDRGTDGDDDHAMHPITPPGQPGSATLRHGGGAYVRSRARDVRGRSPGRPRYVGKYI